MRDLAFTLRTAGRLRYRFVGVVLAGVATIGSSIGLLATSAYLISRAALHPPLLDLTIAIVGVRFFGIARGVSRYIERLASHDLTFRLLGELRVRTFAALARLAPAGVEAYHSGDLLTRLISDVDSLQHVYTRVATPPVVALVVALITAVIGFVLLPVVGIALGAVLFGSMLLVPWLTGVLGAAHGRRIAPSRAEYSAAVVDLIQGAPEIIAFGQEADRMEAIKELDRKLARSGRAAAWLRGFGDAMITLIVGGTVILTLLLAVPAVRTGRLDGVNLAVLVMLALASFEAVTPLPDAFLQLGESLQASARLRSIIDKPDPIAEPDSPLPVSNEPTIALTDAWLRYDDGGWVLKGVDLCLLPGSKTALVGASGAGKTTIAEVLLRFRNLDRGVYRIDGHPAAQFAADEVRARVGLAGESAHVFAGSVRDNLLLARSSAGDSDLLAALERAGLGVWVKQQPESLDAAVGERGRLLSGGERRRLTLARTLLSDFPVTIFDEPTTGLDNETARAVMADYLAAADSKTTLLITHRLEGLDDMDEILVLEEGRIAQRGTHAELVDHPGPYQRMWLEG